MQEIAGIALYGFLANQPMNGWDSLGLIWSIYRERQVRATAVCTKCCTISELAAGIDLDAREYRKWLQKADGGSWPGHREQVISGPRKFTVPNTAHVLRGWVQLLEFLNVWDAQARSKLALTYATIGYQVKEHAFTSYESFADALSDRNGYFVVYQGHGGKMWFFRWRVPIGREGWDDKPMSAATAATYLNHGLARFIHLGCNGDEEPYETLVATEGKYLYHTGTIAPSEQMENLHSVAGKHLPHELSP